MRRLGALERARELGEAEAEEPMLYSYGYEDDAFVLRPSIFGPPAWEASKKGNS